VHYCWKREKKGRKKEEMTTSNKPLINYLHTLHEEEKGEMSLQMKRQIADLATRMFRMRHTKGTNASSAPTLEGHAPVAF
jgi:hypothetical protein